MKKMIPLLFALLSQAGSAQVYNGSFEQGGQYSLAGWEAFESTHFVNCGDLPPDSSTGFFSMKIQAHVLGTPSFSNDCYAFQRLPSVQSGQELYLSYWVMRRPFSLGTPRAWLGVISHESGITHVVPQLIIEPPEAPAYEWQHVTSVIPWIPELMPGDTAAIALVADNTPEASQYIVFDGVELEFSTAVAGEVGGHGLKSWPNPAVDKLWIELSGAPKAVMMIDEVGRSTAATFICRSGMIEVDVSNAPIGLSTLVLTTEMGVKAVRFVKA